MEKLRDIEKIIEKVNDFLIDKISPNLIVLFGSAATVHLKEIKEFGKVVLIKLNLGNV